MVTPYQLPKHMEPVPDVGESDFFEAAKAGRLLFKHCESCGRSHYYPRPLCPYCMSDNTRWVEAAGTGIVYTFSVTRRAGPVPYVIAYVTLDEGVTMMTNIVDCDLDTVHIGQKVRVVYKPTTGDIPIACFAPA